MQGDRDWIYSRLGWVTGSRFVDILKDGRKKGEPSKTLESYVLRIVADRLTGVPAEQASARSLDWGTMQEPHARTAYEAQTGAFVDETGFIPHPALEWVGCSPDGLVDDDGGIEIKSPFDSSVHVRTMLEGMPDEHQPQVQGLMWITGRKWVDFISFDPRFDERRQLYVQRIERDESMIAKISERCGLVIGMVDERLKALEAA